MAAANLLERRRSGFLREGRRVEDEGGLGLGFGFLGVGTEVGTAAAAVAIGGALCKQIREANDCSDLTMNRVRVLRV